MRTLERWIGLHVPKVEDGGNFGVAIQQDALKLVREASKKLDEVFGKSSEYFEQRAKIVDGMAEKQTREQSRAESKSESTGGKDGNESKTSDATTTTTKATAPTPQPHQMFALAEFETKWHFVFLHTLEVTADWYCMVCDAIEKNLEKIERPRGEDSGNLQYF